MRIGAVLCLLLLSGCAANYYREFYREFPNAQSVLARRANPVPAVPKLDRVAGNFEDFFGQYQRAGYAPIGYSSYNGTEGDESQALAVGKELGADVVVVISPRYTETISTSIPLTLPTAQTTYSSGTATIYGSGGSANVYGNSTSTTYGTRTTYIPMTVHRYDFQAVYLVKQKFIFGAFYAPLTDEDRARIQSNKGVRILQVVNDSPAFEADILVGDIVVEVNGQDMSSPEAFENFIQAAVPGTVLELKIIRNGEFLTKTVRLSEG